MFDNTSPYTLRTEDVEGITHYFVSFKDGQAADCETEVSLSVYLELLRSVKDERNLRRSDERHIEQSELMETTLYNRAFIPHKSVEDAVFDSMRNEQLRLAIQNLPEIQRRRFVLHHEFGLTYEQIAAREGCKKQSVCDSVLLAEEKIKEKIKNFKNQT